MSRILFLSNHFITLYSFRRELIKCLTEQGHEVYISTPSNAQNQYFEEMGCKIIPTQMNRRGINPIKDFAVIVNYIKIIKNVKPDIIFSYTIKPNIYGTIASNLLGYPQVCNITGTGGTFLKKNFLSEIAKLLYKCSVKHAYKVFFQNTGDRDYFIENKMIRKNYELLPGSGVNLTEHKMEPMPDDKTVKFIFIGRIMDIKGVEQFFECAKYIRKKYDNTKFYVAGFVEEDKYKKIVEEYNAEGIIDYIGFRNDIDNWIKESHCTILPSIGGEGVPNVLLESAACGRVCIASDIAGSRDVIEDGKTGWLFEKGSSSSLIEKVEKFLTLSYDEKSQMGKNGREKMEKEFDRQIVIDKYLREV